MITTDRLQSPSSKILRFKAPALFLALTIVSGSIALSGEPKKPSQVDIRYTSAIVIFIKQKISELQWQNPNASNMQLLAEALNAAQINYDPTELGVPGFRTAIQYILFEALSVKQTAFEKYQLLDLVTFNELRNVVLEQIETTFSAQDTYDNFLEFVTLMISSDVKTIEKESRNRIGFISGIEGLELALDTVFLKHMGAAYGKSLDIIYRDLATKLAYSNNTRAARVVRDYAAKKCTSGEIKESILKSLLTVEQLGREMRLGIRTRILANQILMGIKDSLSCRMVF